MINAELEVTGSTATYDMEVIKNGASGIAVVEVYDLSGASGSIVANISTRAFVDTGDNVLIGGFIATPDSGAAKILVRGIGPSLTAVGVNVNLAPVADANTNPENPIVGVRAFGSGQLPLGRQSFDNFRTVSRGQMRKDERDCLRVLVDDERQ